MMDLDECFLEDVVRSGTLAQEADEEMENFVAIAFDEFTNRIAVACDIVSDQLLVGSS